MECVIPFNCSHQLQSEVQLFNVVHDPFHLTLTLSRSFSAISYPGFCLEELQTAPSPRSLTPLLPCGAEISHYGSEFHTTFKCFDTHKILLTVQEVHL